MSESCSACLVNWWPDQIEDGHCPMCGSRTTPAHEPVSDDADMLYRIVRPAKKARDVSARVKMRHGDGVVPEPRGVASTI